MPDVCCCCCCLRCCCTAPPPCSPQSFVPHIVIKPTADGTCRMVHLTDGLAFSQLPSKPRGNTQAVLLPAAVSGLNKAVYLGIVHTEVERSYTNYLYQMEVRGVGQVCRVAGTP